MFATISVTRAIRNRLSARDSCRSGISTAARSVEYKLDLAARHGLGGVAAWRLGHEVPQVWDAVSAYAHPQPADVPAPP